jgi:hypothetical protein
MSKIEEALRTIIIDIHWMARRYADMRSTYAPNMLNGRTREALALGVALKKPHFARDGMGRSFDRLSPDEVAAAEDDMPRGHAHQHASEAIERTQKLVDALNRCMIGGNHIANILIGTLGGGFADEYPFDASHEDVLWKLGAGDTYEAWCCWAAIMKARKDVYGE